MSLLPALPCPGKDMDAQLTSSAPFSHSSQEQLTPMDFSFVACAQSMHLLLLPRRGQWISTFLYMCVCVCVSTSFVFTNLSPLPALAKPQCPPAYLHHSLSFSLPYLVCNSQACSSTPFLFSQSATAGVNGDERGVQLPSLILCISFAHWCLLFSSLMFL